MRPFMNITDLSRSVVLSLLMLATTPAFAQTTAGAPPAKKPLPNDVRELATTMQSIM